MCRRSACPVVTQEDGLIQPDRGDDERPVAAEPLARARLQVRCLNDSLEEQLYRLLAVRVEATLPRPAPAGQLLRRQHPPPGRGVGRGEGPAAERGVAEQHA